MLITWPALIVEIGSAVLIWLLTTIGMQAQPVVGPADPSPPLAVADARPLPAISRLFLRTEGWTGADGAYSIPLGNERTLWLFGDTLVGRIDNGQRILSAMINNSAALQALKRPRAPLQFFWRSKEKEPLSLLVPDHPDCWYWPSDGVLIDGKLYLFCMRVARDPKTPPPFSFKVIGRDLLRIDNPQVDPNRWRITIRSLPGGPVDVQLGVSCLVDGEYIYVYGSLPAAARGSMTHPLVLSRIPKADLKAMNTHGFQFWCRDPQTNEPFAGLWQSSPDDSLVLFPDAAPEMTVSRVPGLPGFVACYFPAGFNPEIVLRHAMRPEGPWSDPVTVYRCPESNEKVFVYSAKAHPELSARPGELVITYCRNTATFEDLLTKPDVYFPQAIVVHLALRVVP